MSGTRKILILGNGFDLAHFLPTKYDHFMYAMRNVENYDKDTPMTFQELYTDLISDENYFFENTIKLYKTEEATLPLEEVKELQDDLNKNGWFQYFKSYIDSGIETWIDFENEMEVVLSAVCYIISEIEKNSGYLKHIPYVDSLILIDKIFNKDIKRKYPFINNLLEKFSITDKNSKHAGTQMVFDQGFVKYYLGKPIDICASSLLKHLEEDLISFIEIFSKYIAFIDKLELKNTLKNPEIFEKDLDAIYSFNYSSTIDRLYNHSNINFIHGKAGKNSNKKIVLGISELQNQVLIDNKSYGFVKYYQKLVNNTDYQFLKSNSPVVELEQNMKGQGLTKYHPIEIYIWGHSLDSSDSDYIHEIFSFNQGEKPSIRVIVYYYLKPHAQLSNLIDILDKDTIETWMKNKWLEFMEMPNIQELNSDNNYIDSSISEFSKTVSSPKETFRPKINMY
ncbi:AbiH family protein [Psychrobacter fozii]|uniref:Abortive infection AbiH-like protein n=1 Tax=Psychrobacter fozii TaxID=198480 RepID=A0A2V4V7H1_9GAMM|nr:AbiH family protein [Psychrobacter fozii]PYE40710.1 abortive infection AbiH-like protein [Psychrobacter fozii]